MATPLKLVQYMKSRIRPYGETQVQKLVYYSEAWALALEGRSLFDEPIEAWVEGPVTRSIRHMCGPSSPPDGSAIDNRDSRIVDAVLDFYGHMNGGELSARTHKEEPWLHARVGLAAQEPSAKPISRSEMLAFHTRQALRGDGPRVHTEVADADDDAVAEAAHDGEVIYAGALALLA